ncbi:MAG TPA: MotA/TolQ/ExbB proton channel family protein [bacterium]|uniref:Biopolymer transport protein ExbB n=1 Tax=candidate division TA06 bacterium ADurb.Bin417 TaxID=1852828 RepID=A0A1V5MKY4_UNCT6|nr:MAG: Biopolymer transport protein ExbB [candidate division TA06 bacterium ADurb.Bin417]HNQ35935.1 MotA/TolQ/ExbB proton channel family protein [bacterium]HNS48239.1 MotA/TolQ/ExbB proton channel family protein [bacterium]
MFGFGELVLKGGILMIPIIFCSILSLAVILERAISLHREQVSSDAFFSKVEEPVRRNNIVEAIELCDQTNGSVPRIVKIGLLRHDRRPEEVREAIEETASFEIPYLERYLGILATVATVSPLLGLLGTVTGLVRAFMVIQMKSGLVNPADLAGGIWEALITTVAGLVVAIPTYVAYNYFVSRVNAIVTEMEKSASRLIQLLAMREAPAE